MKDWIGYTLMVIIASLTALCIWFFIIALCIVGDMWGVV